MPPDFRSALLTNRRAESVKSQNRENTNIINNAAVVDIRHVIICAAKCFIMPCELAPIEKKNDITKII